MILWIFAVCLMAVLGLIGYYQGAIRVAFSLVGLLVGALLAMPLAGLLKPVLPIFGVSHPLWISFIGPAIVFVLIQIIFKSTALVVHKKVDTYYKYKGSDTQRSLFERLNQRLGICLGLANATVYVFLLSVVAYVFSYFTVQVSAAEKDSAGLRTVNHIGQDLDKTGMTKAIAPWVPASQNYYDGADIIGDIYHTPLLESRLSSYPAFLALAENKQFKTLADDVKFQQFWLEGRSFGDLVSHDKIQPLIGSAELYTNVLALVKGDLKDLKCYLETGSSAKYDDEKILGRWSFDFKESMGRAKRSKANMTLQDLRRARFALGRLNDAVLTAMIDNRAILKMPALTNEPQTAQGTWKDGGTGKYHLSLADKDRKLDLEATVESNKLVVTKDGYALVFEK